MNSHFDQGGGDAIALVDKRKVRKSKEFNLHKPLHGAQL